MCLCIYLCTLHVRVVLRWCCSFFLICSAFASALSKASNEKGMRMADSPTIVHEFKPYDDLEKVLKEKFLGLVDIVIVVLDGKQGLTYSE